MKNLLVKGGIGRLRFPLISDLDKAISRSYGVLLEQPGRQVTPEFPGAFLPLIEGDELVLVVGAEQQIEGGAAVAEEALAEFLTAGSGIGLRIVQDGYARGLSNGQRRWL